MKRSSMGGAPAWPAYFDPGPKRHVRRRILNGCLLRGASVQRILNVLMSFRDHFSSNADEYARARPDYPEAFLSWIAAQSPGRGLLVDVATGNGQAARGLAPFFERVIALDASAQQIAQARGPSTIEFRVARAEATGLPSNCADALTVAQAAHWFDLPRFFAEVRRIVRPGGLVCLWSYGWLRIEPTIDALIDHLALETLGPFWPPERALVEDGYRGLEFPFEEIPSPSSTMTLRWTMDEVLAYLNTWSATLRFRSANQDDPLAAFRVALAESWGEPSTSREIHWPLAVRAGIVPGQTQP